MKQKLKTLYLQTEYLLCCLKEFYRFVGEHGRVYGGIYSDIEESFIEEIKKIVNECYKNVKQLKNKKEKQNIFMIKEIYSEYETLKNKLKNYSVYRDADLFKDYFWFTKRVNNILSLLNKVGN